MPKLSVSVPDELWKQAQAAAPQMGDSHLVQAALRRYVGGVTGRWPMVRERSEENDALLQQVVERVAERTQATYDEGYRTALGFAETWPWKLVEELAAWGCDLDAWRSEHVRQYEDWRENEPPEEQKFFWNSVNTAYASAYQHDATFRAGFTAGLGDLWGAFTGEEAGIIDPDDLPFE